MKDPYVKNFKTLKKEIKEDLKRWKDLPSSWIGRINIIKMAILPKAIYRSNKIPHQNSNSSQNYKEQFSNSSGITKKNRIAKTILNSKRTSGGNSIPDFKQYYRAIVIKLHVTGTVTGR